MRDGLDPLRGRRILVTRRHEQGGTLATRLRELGGTVVEVPLLEIVEPPDCALLDECLRRIDTYDLVVFTSANAVQMVGARLRRLGRVASALRVASVGPATSEAVRAHLSGARIEREPVADYRAEGLLAAFGDDDVRGRRFLLPVSDRARDVLEEGLRARGGTVDRVVAYCTTAPAEAGPALVRAIAEGIDVVTFASPSAVENFVALAGGNAGGVKAAVIGPVTEARARALGLDVVLTAQPATAEALASGLARAFAR